MRLERVQDVHDHSQDQCTVTQNRQRTGESWIHLLLQTPMLLALLIGGGRHCFDPSLLILTQPVVSFDSRPRIVTLRKHLIVSQLHRPLSPSGDV